MFTDNSMDRSGRRFFRGLALFIVCGLAANAAAANEMLIPPDLPEGQWSQFKTAGYSVPVTGVIYQGDNPRPISGMPLGALDTGCLDIESSGLMGYSSIFNHLSPRGGPVNLPFLGINFNDKTWVLTTGETKKYDSGSKQPPDLGPKLVMENVQMAESIDYWGHYPVLDMEYKTNAPISVGLRAWSPLLPGDTAMSNTPGAFFEVHLRNVSRSRQSGRVAFSFPGFDSHKSKIAPEDDPKTGLAVPEVSAGSSQRVLLRKEIIRPKGVWVGDTKDKMHFDAENNTLSYVIMVLDEDNVRWTGSLGADGDKWSGLGSELPAIAPDDEGTTAVVDVVLDPGQEKVVRYLLVWWAPVWEGKGRPGAGGNKYTHMYAGRYSDAVETARYLARKHDSLLQRVIAWQEEVYKDEKIPGWLADQLINNLYFIPECSFWAQARPPIGYWCRYEDGLFALNEAPRSCPNVETLPNSACGNHPFVYFYPDCILSTLRAHKAYQWKNEGRPTLFFGGTSFNQGYYEVVYPVHGYQSIMNGTNYMVLLDRYWRITGDKAFLKEFYESAKSATQFAFNLRPEYGLSQIVAMPTPHVDRLYFPYNTEWFEDRPYYGYVSHAGGYRMAHARMMRRWAKKMGDNEYAAKMDDYFEAGAAALQKYLWKGDHYMDFNEPKSGKSLDRIFTPQLDGQYFVRAHGLPRVLPKKNVSKALDMIQKACDVSTLGIPPNWVSKDGSVWIDEHSGYLAGKYTYVIFTVQSIAMTYMYEGRQEYGLELLRRLREAFACKQGYTWDGANVLSGHGDNGVRSYGTEYYQNCNLWGVPAALAGQDISGPCKRGGLVDRMIKAARSK